MSDDGLEGKFRKNIADFLMEPEKHLGAFRLVHELAQEPCRQLGNLTLLDDLIKGEGCTACVTCRARLLVDPSIRERWTRRAIRSWNAWIDPSGKSVCAIPECTRRPITVLSRRSEPEIAVAFCGPHDTATDKDMKLKLLDETKLKANVKVQKLEKAP